MSEEFKSGFVTIVGRPNVGKSTLMNHLIGQKIAITSEKPQTTRNRIQTVFTDERGQVIFLDTPGINKPKNKLGEYMVNVAEHTLKGVDLILWLVEPGSFIGPGDRHILEVLENIKTPVILVINKTDKVKKEVVAGTTEVFKGEYNFADIVPVSALKGENLDVLMDTVFSYLEPGPQYYDEDTITDQPVKQIAAELIREKALRFMSEEVPHGIAVVIDQMTERDNGMYDIDATIICEKESHKGMIIGKGGQMLKKIGTAARKDIEMLVGAQVNLKIFVKVRKEWRDSELYMKNFGYDPKDI